MSLPGVEGGMSDPLVLPAKYLCPRSGVSLGDLALPGVERKRECEEKSEGGDPKVKRCSLVPKDREYARDFRLHPLPPTLTRKQDPESSGLSWMGSTGWPPLFALPMPLTGLPVTRKTPSGAQDSPASTYQRSGAFFTTAGFGSEFHRGPGGGAGLRVARGRVYHTEN